MNNVLYINSDDSNTDKTNSIWCISSTYIGKLISEAINTASNIHLMFEPDLPKCVYRLKLYNVLLKKDFQRQTEMSVINHPVIY